MSAKISSLESPPLPAAESCARSLARGSVPTGDMASGLAEAGLQGSGVCATCVGSREAVLGPGSAGCRFFGGAPTWCPASSP